MNNREFVTKHCIPDREVPFSEEEFAERLERVRAAMDVRGIDVLFVSAPEGLYYVSGYLSEWYQAQSPTLWPPASGIAIHRDSGATIHFETEMDEVLARFTSVSPDIRIHRDQSVRMMDFITAELKRAGWLCGTVGLEMFSYRPNRGYSEQFEAALTAAGARVLDATDIDRVDAHRVYPIGDLCLRGGVVTGKGHDRFRFARVDHLLPRDRIERFDDGRVGMKRLHDLSV